MKCKTTLFSKIVALLLALSIVFSNGVVAKADSFCFPDEIPHKNAWVYKNLAPYGSKSWRTIATNTAPVSYVHAKWTKSKGKVEKYTGTLGTVSTYGGAGTLAGSWWTVKRLGANSKFVSKFNSAGSFFTILGAVVTSAGDIYIRTCDQQIKTTKKYLDKDVKKNIKMVRKVEFRWTNYEYHKLEYQLKFTTYFTCKGKLIPGSSRSTITRGNCYDNHFL